MTGRQTAARVHWTVLALVVGACLATSLTRTLIETAGGRTTVVTELIRWLSLFTVVSNVLVLAAATSLAIDPVRSGRLWRVLLLDALLAITVTGLVFSVLLSPTVDPTGVTVWTNLVLHYLSPLAMVVGWLVFGPRPRITGGTVAWAMVFPVAWIGWTMWHGAQSRWYPYFFLDARDLGLTIALRNTAFVVLLALMFLLLYWAADRWLPATPDRPREPQKAAMRG
ncbi:MULTISPECIES: Pr6Pr family membrane protein [unclassified Modestobacter]|uniref:Pr6Pr family membrane protein n=1 Tax=unclassified Modestobacter TaxID=2643866 RepID=UPI0022AAC564|nr:MULTISPECIES: Pr6Pr family membrane protein [unclassified Modestobacter]MCZ2825618.1 Pr6Pr family membrane protein [Modestobacter sp. VKM Ac-2981]MCZ2853317.1 Pr6Pr family membrane protein [Modestobacter sp. VKM Ac-2982]